MEQAGDLTSRRRDREIERVRERERERERETERDRERKKEKQRKYLRGLSKPERQEDRNLEVNPLQSPGRCEALGGEFLHLASPCQPPPDQPVWQVSPRCECPHGEMLRGSCHVLDC